MINSILDWLSGSKEEYEKLEPNFFGRQNSEVVKKHIADNSKNNKYFITGLILILILIVLKSAFGSSSYIYDGKDVIGIQRSDLEAAESFEVRGVTEADAKDVTIMFSPRQNQKTEAVKKDDAYYIEQAAKKAEISRGMKVDLPDVLDNGKSVKWEETRDNTILFTIILILLTIFLMRKSRYSKLKTFKKKSQEDIFNSLPAFINKLIILWKSGATLDEALQKTISSYSGLSFFSSQMRRISASSEDKLLALNQFAISSGVREFKRLTNIMIENRSKGSYLLDKLEDERISIWEKRKEKALEDGKKAETKLVIPMTILLGALIMVTAAPAFLQM